MKFSFAIEKWFGLSSGLTTHFDWQVWANDINHDWSLPIAKPTKIPMMQARRMSIPSRLAVEVGLHLLDEQSIDFAIFVSRHGELERTYKILTTLNQNTDISPTDFALSVHNTAAGLFTIIAKNPIPLTSIAAGQDSFQQALIEAQSLFNQGFKRILLIDFDGAIPDIYQPEVNALIPAYACGFILTAGQELMVSAIENEVTLYQAHYPQSLAFLHAYLNKQHVFNLQGNLQNWQWVINL